MAANPTAPRSQAPAASSRSIPIRPSFSSRPSSARPTSSIPGMATWCRQGGATSPMAGGAFLVRGARPQGNRGAGICDARAPAAPRPSSAMISVRPEDRAARFSISCARRKIQGSSMGSNHFRVDMPRLVEFYMRGKLHLEGLDLRQAEASRDQRGFCQYEGRQDRCAA